VQNARKGDTVSLISVASVATVFAALPSRRKTSDLSATVEASSREVLHGRCGCRRLRGIQSRPHNSGAWPSMCRP
jgi:hypothetical protein